MKKKIELSFILLSLLFTACTHKEVTYHPNGTVRSIIEYKGKKEHGLSVYYRDDGSKKLEIQLINGKKEGKMTRWFTGQKVESESFYKNDLLDGIERIYNRQGELITEIHYKEGKKNGYYASWHARGLLKEEGAFYDDLFDGEWHYFDKRGFPVGEASFYKGNGTLIAYDEEGNLMKITHYVQNLKDGIEIEFASNGDTIKKTTYQQDRIIAIKEY
jgi:antitoxin component YwqK of YwqJK toxin-antitoxin module